MTDVKQARGHSRKLKIGVGGQPLQSWQHEVQLQPVSSQGRVTAAQKTDSSVADDLRHSVAQGTGSKQAFTAANTRNKREASAFPQFHSKNAPVKVSVTGEWALKECEDHTSWANHLLKRGKRRAISDIRRSIGDGQTLVFILETLAGQKIPGVYARPVTRAQKLENLQLCMSFMGNRNINLQGIYVGDLIDGNVKSVLNLCRNVKSHFKDEGWVSPDGPRPSSSGSTKNDDYKLMNGSVPHLPTANGYDIDPRSSGYHSDDASPTRKTEPSPMQDFRMPGALDGHESPSLLRKPVQPSDILIMTHTELDKRGVLQTSDNSSSLVRSNGTISLEDRLRSLLSSPNPGGLVGEETEEELLIPPPPKPQSFGNDDDDDVERRLQSLLDVAEEDKPDGKMKPKDFSGLKELDRIGYVPSHPSQKMRNVQKGRGQARTNSFTGNAKPARGAKLPQAPQNRQHRMESDSPSHSPAHHRKQATSVTPDGEVLQPQAVISQKLNRETRTGSMYSERSHTRKLIRGEGTPPKRFQRANSHSDFLKQVADKLADRSTTSTTVSGSESATPAETPMLPTLSPASSVATFVFVSSSDSSGLSSDEDDYRSRRRSRSYSGSGTPGSRRGRGKAKKSQDLQSIRKQLETLEGMYSEILSSVEVGSKDSKASKDKSTQRAADMRASLAAYKKQRNKDIKAVNKRFGRLESHVVTLARSVAHLSSELRSQASISQDMDDMRRQVNVQQYRPDNLDDVARENALLQSRVKKLRSFFGEDPPLLAIFLKKLGYERFVDNFEAEQVGILELSYMTEERLQSLGIPLGPRLRIMEEVKKLTWHLI